MSWGGYIRPVLKIGSSLVIITFTILYPIIFRDWIFDNIPRNWTLDFYKSTILVLTLGIASLSAFIFLVIPFIRKKKMPKDLKMLSLITATLGIIFSLTTFFWTQYTNDRTWISASYLSYTQNEIEMQTINKVMIDNEILGFHYRALFLKMFQWSFFPIAIVLPMLFMTLGELIQEKDLKISLVTTWILFLAFLIFGFLLYG